MPKSLYNIYSFSYIVVHVVVKGVVSRFLWYWEFGKILEFFLISQIYTRKTKIPKFHQFFSQNKKGSGSNKFVWFTLD
jgi:hypothetical protein